MVAFEAMAIADPPPCHPGASATDNKSCVNFQVLPSNPHATLTPSSLFVHTHTNFAHPGDQAQGGRINTLTLYFDDDFVITPGTIPTCSVSQVAGKTIAGAWATCGAGAGPTHNAYLSPRPRSAGGAQRCRHTISPAAPCCSTARS